MVEGVGLDVISNAQLQPATLKRIARFCEALMREMKPTTSAVDSLRQMAEGVECVDVVAGAITRHVKFAPDSSKQLLCWYLVDSLSKKHNTTFAYTFGPQILDLAVDHMTWTGKEEARYVKLVETWRNIFGARTCEDILRGKDVKKAEQELAAKEKAERVAAGMTEEDAAKAKKPQWEAKDLIVGNVRDGQVMEAIEPCKYYLLGICTNQNCSKPHPPNRFGSLSNRNVFGAWVCLKCGHKNEGAKKTCWRNDCTGTKPEHVGLNLQSQYLDQLVQWLGYDPGVGIEDDATRNKQAIEYYKHQDWETWRAERKRKYMGVWDQWQKKRRTGPAPTAATAAKRMLLPFFNLHPPSFREVDAYLQINKKDTAILFSPFNHLHGSGVCSFFTFSFIWISFVRSLAFHTMLPLFCFTHILSPNTSPHRMPTMFCAS